jgi:hypothetical protein
MRRPRRALSAGAGGGGSALVRGILDEAVALFSPASPPSGSDSNPREGEEDEDGSPPPLLGDQLKSRKLFRSLPARQKGRASATTLASFLSGASVPIAAAANAAAAAADDDSAAGRRRRSAAEGEGAAGKEPPAEGAGPGAGADPPGTLFDRPEAGLYRGSTEESGSSSDGGGGFDEAAPREACLGGDGAEEPLLGADSGEGPLLLLLLPPPPPPALRRSVGILLPAGLVLRRHASCGGRLETSAGQGEGEEEGRMARASMVANLPSRRFSLAPANPLYRAPHGLQAAPAHGRENRLLPRPRRRRWTLLAWLPGRRHPPPAPGAAA